MSHSSGKYLFIFTMRMRQENKKTLSHIYIHQETYTQEKKSVSRKKTVLSMKAFCILLIILLPSHTIGQIFEKNKKDTCFQNNQSSNNLFESERKLPIYVVDSSIFDILNTIVDKDSLCKYYRTDYTGYSVSISKQNDFYLIGIRPLYLDQIEPADYFGIFEFKKRKFLCWGCQPEELFVDKTTDSLTVKFNLDERISIHNAYLGGDVPSKKELVVLHNKKLYFVITASCN